MRKEGNIGQWGRGEIILASPISIITTWDLIPSRLWLLILIMTKAHRAGGRRVWSMHRRVGRLRLIKDIVTLFNESRN